MVYDQFGTKYQLLSNYVYNRLRIFAVPNLAIEGFYEVIFEILGQVDLDRMQVTLFWDLHNLDMAQIILTYSYLELFGVSQIIVWFQNEKPLLMYTTNLQVVIFVYLITGTVRQTGLSLNIIIF